MVFGRGGGKSKEHVMNIKIEGTTLLVVKETKFLGIMLDNGLTWKAHASTFVKELSKSVGILSRARKFLDNEILRQLYFSFLFPYLSYGNIIWGQSADCTLNPIFKLQKCAIRIITNTKRRDSTKLSFQKLNILRLPEIYKLAALIFMYHFKNNLLPSTFKNVYHENSAFHHYPTRHVTELRIPLTRTKTASTIFKKNWSFPLEFLLTTDHS